MVSAVGWATLARRLQSEMSRLVHHDPAGQQLHGDEFYAEALRRAFGYRTNDGADGGRTLPYDTVDEGTGLTTLAYSDYLRESCTILDRLNAEAAKKEAKEAHDEARRVLRDSARDLAKLIRECTNERTVPAKFRREGVLLAADWIDPDSPASPYSNHRAGAA